MFYVVIKKRVFEGRLYRPITFGEYDIMVYQWKELMCNVTIAEKMVCSVYHEVQNGAITWCTQVLRAGILVGAPTRCWCHFSRRRLHHFNDDIAQIKSCFARGNRYSIKKQNISKEMAFQIVLVLLMCVMTCNVSSAFRFVGNPQVAIRNSMSQTACRSSLKDDKTEVEQYFNGEGFNRWNKIYSESDEVNKVQLDIRTGHQQTIDKVLGWLEGENNLKKTVCDAGCGVGSLALPMATKFQKVTFPFLPLAVVIATTPSQMPHSFLLTTNHTYFYHIYDLTHPVHLDPVTS